MMKFRTLRLPLILLVAILALAVFVLNTGIQLSIPDLRQSAEVISIASAPLAVKGLVGLVVFLFGVTSLGTFLHA